MQLSLFGLQNRSGFCVKYILSREDNRQRFPKSASYGMKPFNFAVLVFMAATALGALARPAVVDLGKGKAS